MSIYVVAFLGSFSNVFLRAFQQKNVMKDKFLWVAPTSMCMAAAEYFSLGVVALSFVSSEGAIQTIIATGLGGGLGCLASMIIHNRMYNKKGLGITKVSRVLAKFLQK